MVVVGELLGELVPSEVVAGDDAVHDTDALEDGEIAVGRALGEAPLASKDLRDGEGSVGVREHLDEAPPVRRVALIRVLKPRCGHVVEVGEHLSHASPNGNERESGIGLHPVSGIVEHHPALVEVDEVSAVCVRESSGVEGLLR